MKRSRLRRTPLTPARSRARVVGRVGRVGSGSGPSSAQRLVIRSRAGGCCELCGVPLWVEGSGWVAAHSFHHRQPRGMGGSSVEVNTPDRLLLLCGSGVTGCHGEVESNRAASYARGLLVRRPTDPAVVPVDLLIGRCLLTRSGTYAFGAAS